MPGVIFQRTYQLNEAYETIKARAIRVLDKYLGYEELLTFNDSTRSLTFSSERLIPPASTSRPRVMLLFSNPHPHSVHQGMFLSPDIKGRESLFWPAIRDSGWFSISEEKPTPKQLADICLQGKYQGPFELLFYCYYAFPTDYPEDISTIFGKEVFNQVIQPEAMTEFIETTQETSVQAVVTFNKGIFNLVAKDPIERYVDRLVEGKLIQSQIQGMDKRVPIFLTFPTGWRYRKQYREFRKASLERIRTAICSSLNLAESKDI